MSKTILIVEDDPALALTQSSVLSQLDYRSLVARDGLAAIEECRRASPKIDLILMDIDLGTGMDGTETARQILSFPEIPIVFVSASTDREVIEKTEQITAYGYFVKGSHPLVLDACIKMAFKLHAAKTALGLSEEKYSKAFHTSPDAININRLCDGVYVAINEGFTGIMGYTPREVIRKSSLSPELDIWVDPADRESLVRTLLQDTEASKRLIRFRAKDGSERIGSLSARILTLGGVAHILSVTHDATDEVKIAQELRRSHLRFQALFENSADAMFLVNADGTILRSNQTAQERLQYSDEELTGMKVEDLSPLGNDLAFREALSQGDESSILMAESVQKKKDGTLVPVEVYSRLVDLNGETVVLSTARDVSERRRLDEVIKRTQKFENLGILAGGIAHDFNNLLSGLSGYIDLVRLKLGKEPIAETRERMVKASQVVTRGKALTRQLLTFSRGTAPNRELRLLGPLLKDWAHFSLSGSDVQLVLNVVPDLWPCECDSQMIGQAVDNLLINARHVSPSGGTIELHAENVQRDTPWVRIRVIDHGPGISEELRQKIFDPFFTTKATGTGLGLTSTQSIVQQHRGWIELDSVPGQGATFSLYLPASPGRLTSEVSRDEVEFQGQGWAVVMDDDPALRETLGEILESFGYELLAAPRNGRDAVAFYNQALKDGKSISLFLLDLTIPGGMGGLEVSRILRDLGYAGPILGMTGYTELASPRFEEAMLAFGGLLPKPFSRAELGRFLQRHADSSMDQRVLGAAASPSP